MKIKAIYRKNLKMSTGKIAAQVGHAIIGAGVKSGILDPSWRIIVLAVSDKKFTKVLNLDDKQRTCLMTVSKTIKCTFQEPKKSPPMVAG